ncbi:MAG: ion transporter [Cocleimonas sp.]
MNVAPRKWLYQVLEQYQQGFLSRFINIALMVLILVNVVSIIASSEESINNRFSDFFYYLEIFTLIVFSIEYLLRVWISIEKTEKDLSQPFKSRLRYIFTPMALIDLLAIIPSFLLLLGSDFLILRVLRLVRIFKLTRYSRSMELLITVSKQEAETIISAIFILIILIIVSATGIHIVEGDIQPEEFGSIPRALWWATVTLTTVGYGDVVPITALGRALGIIIVITGIGMAALPAGILASGFTSEINRRRERFKTSIMSWIEEGTFSEHEGSDFTKLRDQLGITRADAALMLREARAELRRSKHNFNNDSNNWSDHQKECPKCGFINKE